MVATISSASSWATAGRTGTLIGKPQTLAGDGAGGRSGQLPSATNAEVDANLLSGRNSNSTRLVGPESKFFLARGDEYTGTSSREPGDRYITTTSSNSSNYNNSATSSADGNRCGSKTKKTMSTTQSAATLFSLPKENVNKDFQAYPFAAATKGSILKQQDKGNCYSRSIKQEDQAESEGSSCVNNFHYATTSSRPGSSCTADSFLPPNLLSTNGDANFVGAAGEAAVRVPPRPGTAALSTSSTYEKNNQVDGHDGRSSGRFEDTVDTGTAKDSTSTAALSSSSSPSQLQTCEMMIKPKPRHQTVTFAELPGVDEFPRRVEQAPDEVADPDDQRNDTIKTSKTSAELVAGRSRSSSSHAGAAEMKTESATKERLPEVDRENGSNSTSTFPSGTTTGSRIRSALAKSKQEAASGMRSETGHPKSTGDETNTSSTTSTQPGTASKKAVFSQKIGLQQQCTVHKHNNRLEDVVAEAVLNKTKSEVENKHETPTGVSSASPPSSELPVPLSLRKVGGTTTTRGPPERHRQPKRPLKILETVSAKDQEAARTVNQQRAHTEAVKLFCHQHLLSQRAVPIKKLGKLHTLLDLISLDQGTEACELWPFPDCFEMSFYIHLTPTAKADKVEQTTKERWSVMSLTTRGSPEPSIAIEAMGHRLYFKFLVLDGSTKEVVTVETDVYLPPDDCHRRVQILVYHEAEIISGTTTSSAQQEGASAAQGSVSAAAASDINQSNKSSSRTVNSSKLYQAKWTAKIVINEKKLYRMDLKQGIVWLSSAAFGEFSAAMYGARNVDLSRGPRERAARSSSASSASSSSSSLEVLDAGEMNTSTEEPGEKYRKHAREGSISNQAAPTNHVTTEEQDVERDLAMHPIVQVGNCDPEITAPSWLLKDLKYRHFEVVRKNDCSSTSKIKPERTTTRAARLQRATELLHQGRGSKLIHAEQNSVEDKEEDHPSQVLQPQACHDKNSSVNNFDVRTGGRRSILNLFPSLKPGSGYRLFRALHNFGSKWRDRVWKAIDLRPSIMRRGSSSKQSKYSGVVRSTDYILDARKLECMLNEEARMEYEDEVSTFRHDKKFSIVHHAGTTTTDSATSRPSFLQNKGKDNHAGAGGCGANRAASKTDVSSSSSSCSSSSSSATGSSEPSAADKNNRNKKKKNKQDKKKDGFATFLAGFSGFVVR
ncbi:unnamed protein product [Amoebophrya sp. A120]|nr:unnamed protein product [Amoebophrya sp. A120]|eukprot:GSA120T00006915001.1